MRALLLSLLLATPALAEDWRLLDDAGITAALTARVLRYEDGAEQNFFDDGRTLYQAGAGESWGKWWVADGKYCEAWIRADSFACYAVEAKGLDILFVGPGLLLDKRGGRYVDL
ncbi:hypothetical protein [Tabrizicola sp.]|uniref:hypothetical protein n=1 Tax=Tabrizicola sp. TaxID=2005166 RepID=UPI003F3353CF